MALENEKSFPFDAQEENGGYDREYVADDFARYFRSFIGSGVFMEKSDNLQVVANDDMTVTLKAGSAIINGYRYDNESDITITLTPADGILNRIDRIAVTWSKGDRDIHYTVREGTKSYEPSAPECRRNEEFKDYVVADILVSAGAISVRQADITDQRLNSEICGLAVPFSEVDTAKLYLQIQDDLKKFQTSEQAEFAKWFEAMKDQLSKDAAGNLQNQINDVTAKLNKCLIVQSFDASTGTLVTVSGDSEA